MALALFLNAFKELILDADILSSDEEVRLQQIRDQFPELSELESYDLSRMPPEKLWIYQRSIIGIERGIIENRLPRSIALLERIWPTLYQMPLQLREEVLASQRRNVWKGYETSGLFVSFQQYLRLERPEIFLKFPHFENLIVMERMMYDVRRAAHGASGEPISPSMPIETLLGSRVVVPEYLRVLHSDVSIQDLDQVSPHRGSVQQYLIYRDRLHTVRHVQCSAGIAEVIQRGVSGATTVESILRDALPEQADDADVERLLAELVSLSHFGVLGIVDL